MHEGHGLSDLHAHISYHLFNNTATLTPKSVEIFLKSVEFLPKKVVFTSLTIMRHNNLSGDQRVSIPIAHRGVHCVDIDRGQSWFTLRTCFGIGSSLLLHILKLV
ncbi:hypothetical protein M9H77_35929 [Catharanthus roseus]|uniref:Uncharacterized protein n=1 Tax=Catharanthus roseus TaxID=4058 RepID=A0ACB9ZQE6_CATRO|nr:hypothetical protein M9H77_35929 [Catharanthus roseus]